MVGKSVKYRLLYGTGYLLPHGRNHEKNSFEKVSTKQDRKLHNKHRVVTHSLHPTPELDRHSPAKTSFSRKLFIIAIFFVVF